MGALAQLIFPEWGVLDGSAWDGTFHAFSIRYMMEEDRSLDAHMDQSEVTLNLCLGPSNFGGAALYFRGQRDTEFEGQQNFTMAHAVGRAVLHVGQHFHGAENLTHGERHNLIVWFRSAKQHRSAFETWILEAAGERPHEAALRDRDQRRLPPSAAEAGEL